MTQLAIAEQLVIALCGLLGIALSQAPELQARRFGCAIGLLAQPVWLHVCWTNAQWGMFALAIGYTAAWSYGVWVYWIRR